MLSYSRVLAGTDLVRTQTAHVLLVLRGCARGDVRALCLRDLDRERPDRGTPAVDEHGLARLEFRDFKQRLVRRKARDREARRLGRSDVLRSQDDVRGEEARVLRERALARADVLDCTRG